MVLKWKSGFILILIGSLLAACAGGSTNGKADGESGNAGTGTGSGDEQKTELRIISHRVEDKAYYDEINAAFQEEYPNITIKYDAVPTEEYAQLRTARTTTGDIDLIASSTEAEILNPVTRDSLADWSGADFLDRFNQEALRAGQYEDKQYFIPISATSMLTFYNKQIFADYGLEVPTTWDEFIAVCETLMAEGIDPIIFGGKDQWPINMIIAQLEASLIRPGGANADYYERMETEEFKFTDENWVEVYEKLLILSQYFQNNWSGLAYSQAPGLFAQGRAAMFIDGSWSLAQIEDANPSFETGAFLLPGSNDPAANQVATTKFGFGWLLDKDTKNKDAALKYVEFITRPENYQKYNDMVRMLPTIDGVSSDSPITEEVLATMDKQMPIWESLQTPGAKYNYTQYAIQMLLGEMTPQEVAEKNQKDFINSKPDWK